MTRSPNGGIFNGADLGADSDFFKVYTVVAHTEGNFGDTNSANRNLVRLMELIQTKVNVKYVKVSSAVVDLSVAANRAAISLGTDYNQAATTVYTISFMAEQGKFQTAAALLTELDGIATPFTTTGVPITGPATRNETAYETSSASAKNIHVDGFNLLH